MAKEKAPWVMPAWMEPYRDKIGNTGGNPIEELINDKTTNMRNNSVRCVLMMCVESQVGLLMRLHEMGVLK